MRLRVFPKNIKKSKKNLKKGEENGGLFEIISIASAELCMWHHSLTLCCHLYNHMNFPSQRERRAQKITYYIMTMKSEMYLKSINV